MTLRAVVILGCRVGGAAFVRRVATGATLAGEHADARIVVSGGRAWNGVVEADAMAAGLLAEGIPGDRVERERRSWSTRENARYTAAVLGPCRVAVVTCDWHLPRALGLFREHGFDVVGVPSPSPGGWRARVWRWGRERVAASLDGL